MKEESNTTHKGIGRREKTLKPCTTLGMTRPFGTFVKVARENANVSQKELALAVGYKSATALSLIESNKRLVSADLLDKVIEVLDLERDYFVMKEI